MYIFLCIKIDSIMLLKELLVEPEQIEPLNDFDQIEPKHVTVKNLNACWNQVTFLYAFLKILSDN